MTTTTTSMLMSTALLLVTITQVGGQQQLECYKCSYFKIESDTTGLSTLLGLISSTSNDHCKLEKEEDKEKIGRVYCEKPDDDEESKCVVVKGEVEGELDWKVTKFDLKYYTVERDCITVKKGEYPDGCQEELPASGPVRSLVGSITSDPDDIEFKGEACYYSYLTTGAQATKASTLCVSLALFFLMAFWNAL